MILRQNAEKVTTDIRSIGILTVARSDYSILRPIIRAVDLEPTLSLRLYVAGMHLADGFGKTIDAILADGFHVSDQIPITHEEDTAAAVSESIGTGVIGYSKVFAREQPDLLILMGDRFECFAAAIAALPFRIPIAHIHGGEITEGAIDDSMRHSITKLSHLHFVSTDAYRDRVIQLGEEPWRVTVTGAPGLDSALTYDAIGKDDLAARLGIKLEAPPILVTFHPETYQPETTADNFAAVLTALDERHEPIIITYPNADTAGRRLINMSLEHAAKKPNCVAIPNLGIDAFYSLLNIAGVMVGNSSSGIIEAASFGLPVINIGDRQKGRICGDNVLHVPSHRSDILATLEKVLMPGYKESLRDIKNPYGDGHATSIIMDRIRDLTLGKHLVIKRFYDMSQV